MLGEWPGGRISSHSAESRERAAQEEADFRPWDESQPYPSSSIPAQAAAKCALLQGKDAFERFHERVFAAFFGDCRDISDRRVLVEVAADAGLDIARFCADFDSGSQKAAVLAELVEGRKEYEGWGVPLAMVGGRYPLVGAVPMEMYRRAIDLCLGRQEG